MAHKEIMDLLNQVIKYLKDADEINTLKTLGKLTKITTSHFDDENRVMEKLNYPHYELHLTAHERVLHKLEIVGIMAGSEYSRIEHHVKALVDILEAHIDEHDMKLMQYEVALKAVEVV